MKKQKKNNLGKNIGYMTIYHIFNTLSPLIVTPYLSRVLGAEEIGKYSYAFSLAYYFVLIANLGITTHGSRRIAEVKDNKAEYERRLSDLFWLHFFNALLITVIYIIALLLGMNKANAVLSCIMTFYVLSSVVDVKWLYYGLEKFNVTVLRSIIIKIIYIILIFICVNTRDDIKIYTFIMAFVAYFLSEFSLFVMLPRFGKIHGPNFQSMKKEFIPLFLLFIPSVANLVLRHFDKLMIGWMCTYEQLGLYENTDKVYLMLVTMVTAVSDVMLPRISNLLALGKTELADKLFSNALRISIMISCGMAFGLMSIANEFVPVFFGKEFLGCIELLTWIAPSIIMLTFSALIRKQYLIPRYMEKVYLTATISSLVINIIFNSFFIPQYGSLGAVFGTLIAEISVVLIQFAMIHKQLSYKPYAKDLVTFSVIGLLMFAAVRTVSKIQLNAIVLLVIEIFVGAAVYVVLAYIFLKITNDNLLKIVENNILMKLKRTYKNKVNSGGNND